MFNKGDRVRNVRGHYGITVIGSTGTVMSNAPRIMACQLTNSATYDRRVLHMQIAWDGREKRHYNGGWFPVEFFDYEDGSEPKAALIEDTRAYLAAVTGE